MGGGAAQTQIKRDVNIEPENIKERRRDDNAALETQRAAALAAASGVAEPPPGTPGTQSPGLAGLEQTMTRQFDAQFGAPSGISVMKTALESVKKSGDSGSEYNAVLARMDRVNILWGGVSNQESFAAVRGDLLDAYDGLIAACNTYLRTHKGFRWTSVGRHRVRRITEIAQFAAERKGAVEAAPIIAPQAPAEEIIEPPQEIPAEPPNPVEFVAAIPAGLAETAAPAEASTEAPAEASTEASAKTPAGAPVVPEDPRRTFYLNNGTWTGNKRKGWLLDLAGDAVRTEMADKFKTHSDAQFANDLAIFNARLTDLQTECGNFLREKRRDNSILRSSAFFDKAQEEMFAIIAGGADAIKADYKADEDIGAAFASVMGNHAAETGTYDRRRHELLAGDMALAEGAVDKNQTILGYLHDTEMEDEAFGEKAKRYRENASAHLDTARRAFVDRFLSPKARESALGRFIESMGGNILKGTVAGAEMTAADMARLAHVKAPDAVELERSFRSDMLDAKFKEEWLPLLYADYGDLDKAARGKADLKAMMLDIIENSQDRITNLPTAADIAAVNSAPKTQRDAFSDFCSWEGFAGILKGHESGIRDAVNKALSAGGIKLKIKSEKKDGEAAKEVTYAKNIDDLSNLAPSRLDKAYAPLRANILTNITEWETISDKALKKQMTEHLVLCPTQEEFMKKLAAARAGAEAREREDKIRFEASLMAPASEKRELQRHAMYYNYTDVAANTALTKEDRDSARLGRLRASAGLREQLKPGDYTEIRDIFLEVYKEAHEAPAGKPAESYEDKMDKNLHDNLKKRLKPIAVRLKKLKPEPKELIAALESTSGAMELLLTEFAPEAVEGGGQFSKSFTSEEHKSYVRKLATATHRAMSRQKELDAALDTAQNLPDERKQLFRANMRDMIVNLAPVEPELVTPGNDSENNKTANQARFGAASWGDALMKLRAMISAETNADAATAENKDLHENSKLAAELMAARLESLKQKTTAEGESIFEYALPLLRKRPATARILMFGTEGEFDALEARLTVPLTLIAGQYSTISLIARQMVLRHFDEMAGEPKSESDWSGIFKKTSDDINKHESVTSIDNMFNRLLDKKNTRNMMRHFPVILEASGGDFEKLASKKGLDEYQKRYSENTKVFSTFWAAQATAAPGGDKSAAAADRKGFEKFVERYMFMLDSAPDPKAKTKGKAAQAAPQADSAYDHGGLLKAYRQGNQGEPAFFDTAFLDYMFTAYKEERTSSLQALALAKQVMNRRRAKRDEIDERRAEGAKATARDDALTRRLREERYAGLSPLMAGMLEHESAAAGTAEEKEKQRTERMNALRDATKTKAVKDTSKGLNTKVIEPAEKDGAISGAVRGSALERRIMGADSNDELSRASVTKLKLLEGRLQAIDFAGHARRLSRAEIEDFMPYVQIFGRAWQAVDIGSGPGPAYDGELQALYASYAKRRKAVADIEAIELTGVALASARDEAARDLSYAIYVLEEDVFAPLAANKERYFKNAQLCEAMFAEEADKHGAPAERVSQNLREYFASDLQKDGLDPETLREGVSALLSDSDTRDYISGVAAKDPISPEKFKALSTDVSYDALEDYELTSRGTDDRRTFEHMLRTDTRWFTDTRLRKSFWKRYSALDLDEKRLFALALTLPDIRPSSAAMPNAGIGAGAEKKAAMRGRNADVAAYIGGEDFKPKVDYSLAIHTLTNRDGTVKGGLFEQDVFNNAYNFVEICRLQRADSQGELSHLLSDPDATLSYNKHFSDEDRKKVISSFSSLTDALRASHGADDKDAKTRIDSLADMGKTPRGMLLIAVLQDRTMLDYTTKMSAWNRKGGDYHPFANESGRDDLLDKYVKTGSVDSLASGEFTNAYLVLNSYQVRDDAKLNKMHSVRKDDLKGGALGRKSAIDWELLDRAFDFVKAAEEERRRIMALGNLVPAENKDANSEFSEVAAMPEDKADESELDRRIKFHAKKDKMLPELAGYLSLGAQEKKLFIKALGRRAALDISKRGIMLNRFGLGSRAYANQGARDDLTDDFVNNGAVSLDSADCHNALRACFSAQIDDSADFKESVSGDVKALAAGSTRNTALDWKLFGRALQFVRRTRDERKMFLEDRTLYNTSGDVATRGEFEYSSGNLRQNVHNAGNRFTRFLGRRVADRLKDQIPAPVLMAVRAALPIKYANKLAKLEFMESEDNSILETAMGVVEAVNEQAEGVPDKVEGLSGIMGAFGLDAAADKTSGFSEAIAGPMETVTGAIGNVKTAYDAISTLYSAGKAIRDSHKTAKDAEEAKKRDELKLATAESERSQLSKDEEEQLKNSLERNRKAANRGQKLAANRKIDEIVNSTAELLGAALEEALEPTLDALPIKLPIAAAVEEAGHFINFIRGYIEDRTNVTEYFNSQSEAEMLKNKLKETADLQLDEKDLEAFDKDKNEMMRRGMGYENYTEMASVVGLSITRSLLFSAGEQGPIEENRIRAVAVLVMLDCKELMGKHDAESAEKLYSAIMASDYR